MIGPSSPARCSASTAPSASEDERRTTVPLAKRALLVLGIALGAAPLVAGLVLAARGALAAGAGLAGAALLAGGLAAQALWVRFDVTGRSVRRGPPGARAVALTFDDGPSGDTAAVLDALDAAGAKAT